MSGSWRFAQEAQAAEFEMGEDRLCRRPVPMDACPHSGYAGSMLQGLPVSPASSGFLPHLRSVSRATLAAWPEARAAVLFGSRARGDHRPDSDWDVAFIVKDGAGALHGGFGALPAGLPADSLPPEVQRLAIAEDLLRRKACSIGHVALGIARDGRILAGTWTRPQVEHVLMQPYEYGQLIRNAASRMRNAAQNLSNIGETGSWEDDTSECGQFLTHSADAGERLAKAMLGRHGIDFARTHDMMALARQAGEAGFPELARTVTALNGLTRAQHTADYRPAIPGVEACRHAVRRLHAVIESLGEELDRAAEDPDLAARSDALRGGVLARARKGRDFLESTAARPPGPGAPEDARASIDSLAEARIPLAEALAVLEARLEPRPDSDLPEPSPFC